MRKNQIIKIAALVAFLAAFVFTGLYFYTHLVKKNSFKPDQFKNGK